MSRTAVQIARVPSRYLQRFSEIPEVLFNNAVAKLWASKTSGMYVYGGTSVYRELVAAALLHHAVTGPNGLSGLWLDAEDSRRPSYNQRATYDGEDGVVSLLSRMHDVTVLVIINLGWERVSDDYNAMLGHMLRYRYHRQQQRTILTSSLQPAQILERYGESVQDTLKEAFTPLDLTKKD